MEKAVFKQGCTYNPRIKILVDGKVPTENDVSKINFRFGNLIKSFPDSEDIKIVNDFFVVRLRSRETLNMAPCCDNQIEINIIFPKGETKPVKPTKGIFAFDVEATGFPSEVFPYE